MEFHQLGEHRDQPAVYTHVREATCTLIHDL
jgi:hypothetical protein